MLSSRQPLCKYLQLITNWARGQEWIHKTHHPHWNNSACSLQACTQKFLTAAARASASHDLRIIDDISDDYTHLKVTINQLKILLQGHRARKRTCEIFDSLLFKIFLKAQNKLICYEPKIFKLFTLNAVSFWEKTQQEMFSNTQLQAEPTSTITNPDVNTKAKRKNIFQSYRYDFLGFIKIFLFIVVFCINNLTFQI